MKIIELDLYQATAVAALVLLLGRVLVSKIAILRKYCIPAPVVGGFIYAILHTILRGMGIMNSGRHDAAERIHDRILL